MFDLITLTYFSMILQIVPTILSIFLGVWVYRTLKSETVSEIANTSSLLASTQTSITHAEIPFPLIAVIAHLHGISLREFQKLWMNEKGKRCRKVLEVYRKDNLTTRFIQKFGSKYLRHGYVGSEALLSSGISPATPSPRSQMSRRAPHTREVPDSSHVEKDKASASARSLSASNRHRRSSLSPRSTSGREKMRDKTHSARDHSRRNKSYESVDNSNKKMRSDDEYDEGHRKKKASVLQKSEYA